MPSIPPIAESEYLHAERRADVKSELVEGVVRALPGNDPAHNLVQANVTRLLCNLVNGRLCLVFSSGQRVHVPGVKGWFYPDVTLVRGTPELNTEAPRSVVNPLMLAEVLAPSTEAYDRGARFSHYRTIPSLQTYMTVSPHERRVEVWSRNDQNRWELSSEATRDGQVALRHPEGTVTVAAMFTGLDLLPPE